MQRIIHELSIFALVLQHMEGKKTEKNLARKQIDTELEEQLNTMIYERKKEEKKYEEAEKVCCG